MKDYIKQKIVLKLLSVFGPWLLILIMAIACLSLVETAGNYIWDSVTGLFVEGDSEGKTEADQFVESAINKNLTEINTQFKEDIITQIQSIVDEKKMVSDNSLYTYNTGFRELDFSYSMAYLSAEQTGMKKSTKGISIDKDNILSIYYKISVIRIEKDSVNKTYSIYNTVPTLEEVATTIYPNDTNKQEIFKESYDLFQDYFTHAGIGLGSFSSITDSTLYTDIVPSDSNIPVPVYYQTDYKNVPYGNGTIAGKGCGPTCVAMLLSYYKNTTITPIDVVNFTGNRYYVVAEAGRSGGSTGSLFTACAEHWGMKVMETKDFHIAIEKLKSGTPIIASMTTGRFTGGSHFLIIRGITDDGYLILNDPNKNNLIKYGTDKFQMDVVLNEAVNFRYFY